MKPDKLYKNRIRWLPVINVSGLVIPPFSLVQAVGSQIPGPTDPFEERNVLQVTQPGLGVTLTSAVLITNDVPILANGRGSATSDAPMYAAYNQADGTPNPGELWGPVASDFTLRKGASGFQIAGTANQTAQLVQVLRTSGAAAFSGARVVGGSQGGAFAGAPFNSTYQGNTTVFAWPLAKVCYDTDGYTTGAQDPATPAGKIGSFTVPTNGVYRYGASVVNLAILAILMHATVVDNYPARGYRTVGAERYLLAGTQLAVTSTEAGQIANSGDGADFWIERVSQSTQGVDPA